MEFKVEYLNHFVRRSEGPILKISREYYFKTNSSCDKIYFLGQEWYFGKGVTPLEHPAINLILPLEYAMKNADCLYCNSKNVLVIALQASVSENNGNAYYDYEIVCNECNKFSAVSYADN